MYHKVFIPEELANCVNEITVAYMMERHVFTGFIMCVYVQIKTLITALSHCCTHRYIRLFKYFVSVSILTCVIIEDDDDNDYCCYYHFYYDYYSYYCYR